MRCLFENPAGLVPLYTKAATQDHGLNHDSDAIVIRLQGAFRTASGGDATEDPSKNAQLHRRRPRG